MFELSEIEELTNQINLSSLYEIAKNTAQIGNEILKINYKINKKELIIPQPKVPAPTTRKASLFPRFVAFSKKVVP